MLNPGADHHGPKTSVKIGGFEVKIALLPFNHAISARSPRFMVAREASPGVNECAVTGSYAL